MHHHSPLFYRLFCVLTALAFSSACGRHSNNSELRHTIGEPVRAGAENGLDWAASADPVADFMQMNQNRLSIDGKPARFAAATAITTKYMQSWLDTLDAMLRASHPTTTQFIPKPVALVWASEEVNAFASPMAVCVEMDVEIKPDATEFADIAVGLSFSGSVFPVRDTRCLAAGKFTANEVALWFKRNNGSCDLSTNGEKLVIGQNCKLAPALVSMGVAGARRIQLIATSPVITMTAGMFGLAASTEQFVAVLTHELAHYYRSHPSLDTKKYNFFYELEAENPAQRPQKTNSAYLKDLGERAIKADRVGSATPDTLLVMREAQDRHLGYYTFEQEADELAVEWLAQAGINPDAMIENLFRLLASKAPTVEDKLAYDYKTCLEAYNHGWHDSNDKALYVPVGTFANPHHSLCYRIFNVSREIAAHTYHIADHMQPAPAEATWSQVQAAAKDPLKSE